MDKQAVDMAKSLNSPAKRKAWNMLSRYIRIRDCLATTNFPFAGLCKTCLKRFHIDFLDAGHLFAGGGNAKTFPKDDRQICAQCRICNRGRDGRHKKFRKIMEERYGKELVAQWEIDGKKVIHDNEMDFGAIEKKYKEKYLGLLRDAGYRDYDDHRNS